MSAICITLSAANLGPEADEAFFDSWNAYVVEHIDEHVGFRVDAVDQRRFGESGPDLIEGATDEQREALRDALSCSLWEKFCESTP